MRSGLRLQPFVYEYVDACGQCLLHEGEQDRKRADGKGSAGGGYQSESECERGKGERKTKRHTKIGEGT